MRVRCGSEHYEITGRMTASKLLQRLGMLPEAVVVVKGDEIVTEDETLEDGDEVELIRVVSGGSV